MSQDTRRPFDGPAQVTNAPRRTFGDLAPGKDMDKLAGRINLLEQKQVEMEREIANLVATTRGQFMAVLMRLSALEGVDE